MPKINLPNIGLKSHLEKSLNSSANIKPFEGRRSEGGENRLIVEEVRGKKGRAQGPRNPGDWEVLSSEKRVRRGTPEEELIGESLE
ncbi:hypothetical protein KM043_014282 [Ampulex compressa]|nr:hypothetical protein KM043_014282 [Ampulex compressa]